MESTENTQEVKAPETAVEQKENPSVKEQPEKKAPATKVPKTAEKKGAKSSDPKPKKEGKPQVSALEKVGRAAIEEHDYPEVFVTSDGTPFRQKTDALNHAANLPDKAVLTVKK